MENRKVIVNVRIVPFGTASVSPVPSAERESGATPNEEAKEPKPPHTRRTWSGEGSRRFKVPRTTGCLD